MSTSKFTLETLDGDQLYGRAWVPENPMAIICLVHGLGEHIERYNHVATYFNQSGIAVYGVDQRGHGHNPGKKGHAQAFNLWDDTESIMKEARLRHLNTPMFLYGHSWGGNVVSNFILRRNSSEIKGAILSSPWLKLSFQPAKWQLILGSWMSRIHPSFTQQNGLLPEFLSRDPAVGENYLKDPLVHQKISAGLFNEARINGQFALDQAHQLSIPVLVIHGTADKITSPKASETFAGSSERCQLKLWPDMRHETHNEIGKEQVLEYVLNWIIDRLR